MSSEAERQEAALEEEARQRSQEIHASEDAVAEETSPSSDAEIAQVHRSGRQHDHSDAAAYQRSQYAPRQYGRRGGGPRR
ncbi:hypothetical protein D0Z08_28350 [Nocardioides immobilis]|uniref:Uncharacterized protein n=1 Tax=Nocardioides immobilis TaxID=2049295 RepID=A0A417XTE1_9ACTN|nr:hypothetical protein [Nocardioides immobilis]RHW23722.1 hypothetical protein D0Z08_28350 [Nocardioides immobilis]